MLLQPRLAQHELCPISGWYSGRLLERPVAEELVAIEPHRALLAAMSCTVLVYAETSGSIAGDRTRPLSSRPSLPDGDLRDFGIRLTELADRLAERGMRLAYHHHMGTVVETAAEIDHLMAATGRSVGLLLDPGIWFLPALTRPISDGGIDRESAMSTARISGQVCWRALARPI